MKSFFIMSSILSFVGALAFILVVMETGKLAFIGMSIVMVCNGISFWSKSTAKENAEETN